LGEEEIRIQKVKDEQEEKGVAVREGEGIVEDE
jgi:hypothetical protein